MADTKITALTALTAADPSTDVLPIVDTSDTTMAASGTTKKISINNILGASGTATLASASITGDLTVDTSTLKVDSANNRVGIGTSTPARPLDIVGSFQSSLGWVLTGTPAGLGAATRYIGGASTTDSWYYNAVTGGSHLWAFGESLAMTLNSTGLGVGVTPSAWPAASKAIDVDSYGANYAIAAATQVGISRNCYYNGTNWIYKLTTSAQRFEQDNGGGFKWFTAAAGTAGTAITFTERLRLKETGQLRFVPLAADPSGAEAGDVYYNSTSNKLKCYNGTTWNDLF